LTQCQRKLEILDVNPSNSFFICSLPKVSFEVLRDREKLNTSLDEFFASLSAVEEALEEDKRSLSENITTSSALLVSLGLLENQDGDIAD
jgi:hypothetical protein